MTKETQCPSCGHKPKITTNAKRTTCSQCDTKIPLKAVVAILAVVMMFAVVPVSYAEISVIQENLTEAEQKVLDDIAEAKADGTYVQPPEAPLTANVRVYSEEIPIKVNHPVDLEAVHCWTNFDLYVPTTHCILPGFPPVPESKFFDSETGEWTPVEELIEQHEESQEEIERQSMTKEEKYIQDRIEYLKQKTNPTDLDLEELELREQLGAICANDTLVSQTYREFDVVTEKYLDHEGVWREKLKVDQSVTAGESRDNRFVIELKKQVQECIGQPHTKKSSQYDHIVVDDSSPDHRDKASHIPSFSQDKVNSVENDGVNVVNEERIKALICDGYSHSKLFKDAIGCEYEYPPSVTAKTELKDYNETDPRKKWLEYQDDPDSQLDSIMEKVTREYYRSQNIGGQ